MTTVLILLGLVCLLFIAFVLFTFWGFSYVPPRPDVMEEINKDLPPYPPEWGEEEEADI